MESLLLLRKKTDKKTVIAFALLAISTSPMSAQTLDLNFDDFTAITTADFKVTTFTSGLNFPYGMTTLSDGSLLVATSNPNTSFFNSSGELLRLTDSNNDGIADSTVSLFNSLPGTLTGLERSGDYVFASSAEAGNESIHILKTGANPVDPLTSIGSIEFSFPAGAEHKSYGLAARQTAAKTHEVFFNIGSVANNVSSSDTVSLSGMLAGSADVESIYKFQLNEQNDGTVQIDSLEKIASGLRNAAGITFNPSSGDLLFQDNGIDTPGNRGEALSADELNKIDSAEIGGVVEDFGFAATYVNYNDGSKVGGSGIDPLFAFTPLDGQENEGATELAFAPERFPEELRNGVFIGFHGEWNESGLDNEENPLVFADLSTGLYHHIVEVDQLNVGHLNGLHSTKDALYIADMTGTGSLYGGGTGVIYKVSVIPETPTLAAIGIAGIGLLLQYRRRNKKPLRLGAKSG